MGLLTISESQILVNDHANFILTSLGSSAALKVYSGTVPANVDVAITSEVLLCEHAMNSTPFVVSDTDPNGVLTANAIADDVSANATGTPTFFRIETGTSTEHIQGSAGVSSGDLSFNASIVLGQTVLVSALVLTILE